jgi:hypothetical protein
MAGLTRLFRGGGTKLLDRPPQLAMLPIFANTVIFVNNYLNMKDFTYFTVVNYFHGSEYY